MTEQSKILATLRSDYEIEQGKVDELNVAVRESKAKMLGIRAQMQTIDNEIQAKEKTKDDLNENLTKREAMVLYHRKQIKHLTVAMVQYEVSTDQDTPVDTFGTNIHDLPTSVERIGQVERET